MAVPPELGLLARRGPCTPPPVPDPPTPPPKENIGPVLAPLKLVNVPLPAVVLYALPVDFPPADPTTAVKSSPPTTV